MSRNEQERKVGSLNLKNIKLFPKVLKSNLLFFMQEVKKAHFVTDFAQVFKVANFETDTIF